MASKEFPLTPEAVPLVETSHRRIQTPLPVPESIPLLERMRACEPASMSGQPPVVWRSGEGAYIRDPFGNQWIDFSSGVLVAACGHGHPAITSAIRAMADQGLYHAYCFPTGARVQLVEKLRSLLPPPLSRVFLLTTGSEAVECCLKLARTHGPRVGGPAKKIIVSFTNAFHGRTMGSQLAGGIPVLKAWMGELDPSFVQVPFPDGYREPDVSFATFEKALAARSVAPENVCGVISETFQGCNACLIPTAYARELRAWCDRHGAVLIFDEIQAAFGRTGRWFGFEHLGVVPDLASVGKGVSGGMPLSAVFGTDTLMNLYGPGEMTSTHSANPVCAAAALANIETLESEHLLEHTRELEPVLREGVRAISRAAGGRVGHAESIGLVAAVQFARPGTIEPDPGMAWRVVDGAWKRGVLLFAPVGVGGGAIKICPPLVIGEDALREGLTVLEELARD